MSHTHNTEETQIVPATPVSLEVVPAESEYPVPVAKQQRIDELVHEIGSLHTDILDLNSNAEELVCRKANAVRMAGLLLIELKEHTKHGGFVGMFAGNKGSLTKDQKAKQFAFSADTARNYMRFAKHWTERPLEIEDVKGKKTLTEVQTASGSLTPKTKKGEKLHDEPSVTEIFMDLIMVWNKALNAARKILDEREWDRDTCAKVKRQLQPIVDFYNAL